MCGMLLLAYVVAYAYLVQSPTTLFQGRACYRVAYSHGGEFAHVLFLPVHYLDRHIRRQKWARKDPRVVWSLEDQLAVLPMHVALSEYSKALIQTFRNEVLQEGTAQ